MNERIKKITEQMSAEMQQHSMLFLAKHLQNEEETSDVINILLSAHLTCLSNSMMYLAEDHELMKKAVENFLHELFSFISRLSPISNIEIMENKDD